MIGGKMMKKRKSRRQKGSRKTGDQDDRKEKRTAGEKNNHEKSECYKYWKNDTEGWRDKLQKNNKTTEEMLKEAEDLLNEARSALQSRESKEDELKDAGLPGKTKTGSSGKAWKKQESDARKKNKSQEETEKADAGTKKATAGKKKTLTDDADKTSGKFNHEDFTPEDSDLGGADPDDFGFEFIDLNDPDNENVPLILKILSAYISALEENNVIFDIDEKECHIVIGFQLENKLKSTRIVVDFYEDGAMIYALVQKKAPEKTRQAVMEYITRSNFSLKKGCFVMNLSDGGVYFRMYVSYEGYDEIPEKTVLESVFFPVRMMEIYGDGIYALMRGYSDPETEVEKAEKPEMLRLAARRLR